MLIETIDLAQKEPFKDLIDDLDINQKSLASQSDIIVSPKTFSKILAVTYESGQYDSFHFKTAIGDEFADPKVADNQKTSKIDHVWAGWCYQQAIYSNCDGLSRCNRTFSSRWTKNCC